MAPDPRRPRRRRRRAFPPRIRTALAVVEHELVTTDALLAVVHARETPAPVTRVVGGGEVVARVAAERVRWELAAQPLEAVVVCRVDERLPGSVDPRPEQRRIPGPAAEQER